jgi:tetratricopeptide (TPR) repeat protein
MRLNVIGFGLGGIFIGFVIGFLTASSINRSEINQLRADRENTRKSMSASSTAPSGNDLSDEELRDKIAEADQDPSNAAFQKDLGLALYRYGALKNDTKIISEAIRLLDRAAKLSPSDSDIVIGLGNAWFDIGYENKDNESLTKAREFYIAALSKTPRDAGIRTDLGMTYFLEDPPNDQKAIDEFKKAIDSDPKQQKALEFIVQSLARQGDKASAQKYLDKLREAYPSDDATNSLSTKINDGSNTVSK